MDAVFEDLYIPNGETTFSVAPGESLGIPIQQPKSTGWDVALTVLSLLAILLAAHLWWRLRALRREVRQLASQVVDGYTPPPSRFGLPKFGMRTLLVLVTLVAVVLGTFGSELMRARRQSRVLEEIEQAGKFGTNVACAYQLGLLGDGALAQGICQWIHPHFGCRLQRLSLNFTNHLSFSNRHTEEGQRIQGDVDLIGLSTFRDLEELQLSQADLGDESLQAITSLKKLRRLSLIDCRLPENSVRELAKLPNLRSLQLRYCSVTDEALAGLERMTELRELNLSENPFSDASAERLTNLEKLTTLNLAGVKVSGATMEKLSSLPKLQSLDLQRTEVDLDVLQPLTEIASLRYVALFGSKVGWQLKPSEHKQAEEVFGDHSAVKLHWHSLKNEALWNLYDNRPGVSGNPFAF
ncbi:leucine-rich repeat domain-containing protein [Aeoliella sp.]|uniref:leucine-rich repeat domain-containing protein n=1 Tax=Aeoliella sp. TaxID=2795800 RepID=UPI003CCBB36C